MIRKTVAMISLIIMMMSVSSFAEVSQYEIKDRFTPTGLYMLYGNNMVSETWPDRDGRTDQGWYVTWFQDRKILREVAYDPDGKYRYYAAPHKDGTCGILKMELPDAANMADEKRYSNLILYDWDCLHRLPLERGPLYMGNQTASHGKFTVHHTPGKQKR